MTDYAELKLRAQHAVGFSDISLAPDLILALIAQNETLTKIFTDAPDLPDTDVEWLENTRLLEAERDQLKAENEALRKDAERYRWLREYKKPESEAPFICQQRLMFGKLYYAGPLVAGALDREVDSAMGKGEQP